MKLFQMRPWLPLPYLNPPSVLPGVLTDNDVDERRPILLQRALERGFDSIRLFHALAEDAEGVRQPGEVDLWAGDLGAHFRGDSDSVFGSAKLVFYRHIGTVVENDHDQRH